MLLKISTRTELAFRMEITLATMQGMELSSLSTPLSKLEAWADQIKITSLQLPLNEKTQKLLIIEYESSN